MEHIRSERNLRIDFGVEPETKVSIRKESRK